MILTRFLLKGPFCFRENKSFTSHLDCPSSHFLGRSGFGRSANLLTPRFAKERKTVMNCFKESDSKKSSAKHSKRCAFCLMSSMRGSNFSISEPSFCLSRSRFDKVLRIIQKRLFSSGSLQNKNSRKNDTFRMRNYGNF